MTCTPKQIQRLHILTNALAQIQHCPICSELGCAEIFSVAVPSRIAKEALGKFYEAVDNVEDENDNN